LEEEASNLEYPLVNYILVRHLIGLKANLPCDCVDAQSLSNFPIGVYYGLASVNNGPVYKMAMSIGWNPYFKNTEKTVVSLHFELIG
jgi:FAD synthase